jgi:hypothetical protein
MSVINSNYQVSVGQFGLRVIEVTGRCTREERAAIEANVTRRYDLVPLPNSGGAILKTLDGSTPRVVEILPDTFKGQRFRCVKVSGVVNPMAPEQHGGSYSGRTILRFAMRYQEVGGVA